MPVHASYSAGEGVKNTANEPGPRESELQKWRDLSKLTIVAAFFGVCFIMLAGVIGYESPWLGLLLMFYFMALAKVAEPLFMMRLPKALHAVKPERGVYRCFGVRHFGALLRNTPLRYLNASVYLAHGRHSLAELRHGAESSEAIHFWAAVLFTPYIAYLWARGHVTESMLFVLVQLVFNVYPILHLRLVRARLDHVPFHRKTH